MRISRILLTPGVDTALASESPAFKQAALGTTQGLYLDIRSKIPNLAKKQQNLSKPMALFSHQEFNELQRLCAWNPENVAILTQGENE
jgi:hypothetical protein